MYPLACESCNTCMYVGRYASMPVSRSTANGSQLLYGSTAIYRLEYWRAALQIIVPHL